MWPITMHNTMQHDLPGTCETTHFCVIANFTSGAGVMEVRADGKIAETWLPFSQVLE